MEQFIKYKLDDHTPMYAGTTQFMVCNYLLNTTLKIKVYLDKIKILLSQVNLLSYDLTRVKSNQNSTYDTVCKLKDRGISN